MASKNNNIFWVSPKNNVEQSKRPPEDPFDDSSMKFPKVDRSSQRAGPIWALGFSSHRNGSQKSSTINKPTPISQMGIAPVSSVRDQNPISSSLTRAQPGTMARVQGSHVNSKSSIVPNLETTEGNSNRPVSELPVKYRSVFPYVSFNHVQSSVFESVINSRKPVVVSAPTGSGKTGVFELAIVKLLMDYEQSEYNFGAPKVVYLAPTKALCTERCEDWDKKFSEFDIKCIALTSDMDESLNFRQLSKASILVATPEKWDSITRNWVSQRSFVQSIGLLLVDEIHLVNDGSRGATLEAVISRMKTIRSQVWPHDPDRLRFIAASATISNVNDIAEWFSTPKELSDVYRIDPKTRPVKLKTLVLGFDVISNVNEFAFDAILSRRLNEVIKEHSEDKPTLIFCSTRKITVSSANSIVKNGGLDMLYSADRRTKYLKIATIVKEKSLQDTMRSGVAYHHAGLSPNDRRVVENGFLDGQIMILCCTSTLSLGVNLPAHLVIIKNTLYFDEGKFKPYPESSIVQMIGRAGRPQFDTHATAVIMTRSSNRESIQKMLTGQQVVESRLHNYLTEHLNSEVVLGTIKDDIVARKWIDSTYLSVRLMKAPECYGLPKKSSKILKENTIVKWCKESIDRLILNKMISRTQQDGLESTEAGRAMARHYICLDSAVKLINLKGDENLWDLIRLLCTCQEISSDLTYRQDDRSALINLIKPKNENDKLRFPFEDDTNTFSREKKAAILIQANFGNITILPGNISQEIQRILRSARRLVHYLRDVTIINQDINFRLFVNVLVMTQCFHANLWENSIYVSKQLDKIGTVLSRNLADNLLTSFAALKKANPRNIELACNRLAPFGTLVQQTCFGLPEYDLKVYFKSIPNCKDKVQLLVEVIMVNGQDLRIKSSLPKAHECILAIGNRRNDKLYLRHYVSDAQLIERPDLTACYGVDIPTIDLPDKYGEIDAYLISDMFVGLDVHKVVQYIEPETHSFDAA